MSLMTEENISDDGCMFQMTDTDDILYYLPIISLHAPACMNKYNCLFIAGCLQTIGTRSTLVGCVGTAVHLVSHLTAPILASDVTLTISAVGCSIVTLAFSDPLSCQYDLYLIHMWLH